MSARKSKRLSFNDLYIMSFVFGLYTVFSLSRLFIEDDTWGWIVGIILAYLYYLWFTWRAPDVQKADRWAQLEKLTGDLSESDREGN